MFSRCNIETKNSKAALEELKYHLMQCLQFLISVGDKVSFNLNIELSLRIMIKYTKHSVRCSGL